jgi:hypothetical protein
VEVQSKSSGAEVESVLEAVGAMLAEPPAPVRNDDLARWKGGRLGLSCLDDVVAKTVEANGGRPGARRVLVNPDPKALVGRDAPRGVYIVEMDKEDAGLSWLAAGAHTTTFRDPDEGTEIPVAVIDAAFLRYVAGIAETMSHADDLSINDRRAVFKKLADEIVSPAPLATSDLPASMREYCSPEGGTGGSATRQATSQVVTEAFAALFVVEHEVAHLTSEPAPGINGPLGFSDVRENVLCDAPSRGRAAADVEKAADDYALAVLARELSGFPPHSPAIRAVDVGRTVFFTLLMTEARAQGTPGRGVAVGRARHIAKAIDPELARAEADVLSGVEVAAAMACSCGDEIREKAQLALLADLRSFLGARRWHVTDVTGALSGVQTGGVLPHFVVRDEDGRDLLGFGVVCAPVPDFAFDASTGAFEDNLKPGTVLPLRGLLVRGLPGTDSVMGKRLVADVLAWAEAKPPIVSYAEM